MRIGGLDISLTGTGVAVWTDEGGPARFETVARFGRKGKKGEGWHQRGDRIDALAQEVHGALQFLDLDFVLAESPAYSTAGGSTWDRAGAFWQIIGPITSARIPFVTATPQQLKMFATGKGTAEKGEVMAAMLRRFPEAAITDDNTSDAVVLAAMGAARHGLLEVPKYAQDVLVKVFGG